MTLTRAQVEYSLVGRCKKRMEFVGMATASDGDNADLNEPIATALMQMGIPPADVTNVQDSDLTNVPDMLELFDLAELRLLENIHGNVDVVDIRIGDRSESLSQFDTSLLKAIEMKTKKIQAQYGVGLGTLSAGIINLNFQARRDEC